MSLRFNPYLVFSGNAREAMTFYHSVLGGELNVSTFRDFNAVPNEELADKVMHAQLNTPNGLQVLASDGGTMFPKNEGVGTPSVEVAILGSVDDEATVKEWFDGLSDGGSVSMPMEKAMWGDIFGSFTDKFGVQWMVNLEAPKA